MKPDVVCPSCHCPLQVAADPVPSWRCKACEAVYPLVRGRRPILVKDARRFLAGLYLQYEEYGRQSQVHSDSLDTAAQSHPDREGSLREYQTAFHHNAERIRDLMEDLQPHIPLETLATTTG